MKPIEIPLAGGKLAVAPGHATIINPHLAGDRRHLYLAWVSPRPGKPIAVFEALLGKEECLLVAYLSNENVFEAGQALVKENGFVDLLRNWIAKDEEEKGLDRSLIHVSYCSYELIGDDPFVSIHSIDISKSAVTQ